MNFKRFKLFLLFFIIVFLFNCTKVTSINKILNDPAFYEGKTIYIKGDVVKNMSLLWLKYYILKDKTGEIRVVTKKTLPKEGDKIKVKGKIKVNFDFGDKKSISFIEEERFK